MEKSQRSKLILEIPPVDVVITMGCNVQCPFVLCKVLEDWGLEDQTGKSDAEFIKVINIIEEKVKELSAR